PTSTVGEFLWCVSPWGSSVAARDRNHSPVGSPHRLSQSTELGTYLRDLGRVRGVEVLTATDARTPTLACLLDHLLIGGILGLFLSDQGAIGAYRAVDRLQRGFVTADLDAGPGLLVLGRFTHDVHLFLGGFGCAGPCRCASHTRREVRIRRRPWQSRSVQRCRMSAPACLG